jgi:hypothetical protein
MGVGEGRREASGGDVGGLSRALALCWASLGSEQVGTWALAIAAEHHSLDARAQLQQESLNEIPFRDLTRLQI